jgi:hypothetical protein
MKPLKPRRADGCGTKITKITKTTKHAFWSSKSVFVIMVIFVVFVTSRGRVSVAHVADRSRHSSLAASYGDL